jgi:hypothetical protein
LAIACGQIGMDDIDDMMKDEMISQLAGVLDYKHRKYLLMPRGTSG